MSGHWENRRYAIVGYPPAPEVWGVVLEEDETCRKSVDGSQVVVKWEGTTPAILSGVATYTNAEILAVLAGSDWTPDEPPP